MEAVGVFLNSIPHETLYVKSPKGYTCKTTGTDTVSNLKIFMYGLNMLPQVLVKDS